MRTERDDGREPVVRTPALRPAPATGSKVQPTLRPRAQTQQKQPPTWTTDFSTLFQQPKPLSVQVVPQQKKPLSVQIVPQQEPVALQSKDSTAGTDVWTEGTFPVSTNFLMNEIAAKNAADASSERVRQVERTGKRTVYEAADRSETAVEMTPKQWASFSPQQQAAAQWNYDLSQAVKKDFESQGKNTSDAAQTKGYKDRVKELFGEEESLGYKGLDFAPNTIALLDARGLKAVDLAGHTLDDMLSGNALVTTDTFDALGEQVKAPDVFHTADARGQNIQFAQNLAKGQLAYQEELASKLKQGEQLLTSITSESTNATANKSYGAALQTPTHIPLTAVRPDTLAQFDKYMEVLARTDITIDLALDTINKDMQELGVSDKESEQVWQGLSERSRQAMSGKGKWFEGVDFPMRSPVEVAQALGAPTLKRQATLGAK